VKLFKAKGFARDTGGVEAKLKEISDRLDRLEDLLDDLRPHVRMLPAIVRKLYLSDVALPAPYDLLAERFPYRSQNEEDGLLLALFKRIGTTDRRTIEIGCGLNGGNSGFLVAECGWTGLMMDADRAKLAAIRQRYSGHAVTTSKMRATRETINGALAHHGFAGEVDLLSIDIDGMDYWVWDAVTACNPRVVAIEYNWLFGPERSVTVPYDADFKVGAVGTRAYRGASLMALVHLGHRKGYRLVATERVNAVFLRNDIAPEVPEIEAVRAYRPPSNLARSSDVFEKIQKEGLPLVTVTAAGEEP
jgi:hypothetical protein